jgi:hypothetical protein
MGEGPLADQAWLCNPGVDNRQVFDSFGSRHEPVAGLTRRAMKARLPVVLALAGAALFAAATPAADINPADYPKLSGRQIAVLRDIVERSRQPLAGWPRAQFGYGPTAGSNNPAHSDLIYQVRADASALAQAQHDKLPAYRELLQGSMGRLIQKMLEPPVWGAWYELSRWEDGLLFERGGGQISPWADPFRKHNIMYSGNLFQMLGYYAMLYGDRKYDAPGALTYVWDQRVAKEVDARYDGPRQTFRYDHTGLAKALHRQYVEGNYVGIACQPRYAFTLCNEVPILAYRHYDLTHGTDYAPEVEARYLANEKWDARTQRFMIFVNQLTGEPHFVQPEQQLAGDPIGGMYWHYPINKDLVAKSYQYHRDIALQFYVGNVPDAIRDQGIGFGFFANYAAEVGDLESRDKLIAYADRNFDPEEKDGRHRYSITDIAIAQQPKDKHFEVWQGNDHRSGVRNIFGGQANSLMAMAQLNDGGAQWRLYNRPWTAEHFKQPFISGVDYPRVLVNQAVFDPAKDALIVGLQPGTASVGTVSFDVNRLDPRKRYRVEVDGREIGRLEQGKTSSAALRWSRDKVLTVEVNLAAPRSIVIRGDA